MKYIKVFVILLYVNSAFSQLIFDTTYVRRNVHFSESTVHTKITFKNKGTDTVIIKNINSSCGCIVPSLQKLQYNINESGFVEIIFNVSNRTGIQKKTVLVETDTKQYTIDLEYIIESPLTISSTSLVWIENKEFDKKEIYIKTNSSNIKNIKVVKYIPNFQTALESTSPNEFRLQISPLQTKIGQYKLTLEAQYVNGTEIKSLSVPIRLDVIPIRKYLTVAELKGKNDVIIIDARQPFFFNKQHIPTAINIPVKDFDTKKEILKRLLHNSKDKDIIIYCSSDSCPDATILHDLLYSFGFQNLHILRGGIDAWINQSPIQLDLES